MDDYTSPHWRRSALLTVDMQRDFVSNPQYQVPGTAEVLPNVRALAGAFRTAGRPIVHLVRLYLPDGSNADLCRRSVLRAGARLVHPGSPGAELADGLALDPGTRMDSERLLAGEPQSIGTKEWILFKPRWGGFFGTQLDATLRGEEVDTVAVAGCNFPNCPRATIIGASERDFRVLAVSDALSQWTEGAQAELAGIGVTTLSTVSALHELQPAQS